MNEKKKKKISRYLSLVLRHKPEVCGVTLNEGGWVNVDVLIKACAKKGNHFSRKQLEELVETNDKKRFALDESGKMIRASQGHSLDVKLDLEEKTPPKILYHGTAKRNAEAIQGGGLQKMQRHHVHLSADTETARDVGTRYGKPVIFKIDTERMLAENFKFFVSDNGVWLVDGVPPKFLEVL